MDSANGDDHVEHHERGSPPADAYSNSLEPSNEPSISASTASAKHPETSIASDDQSLTSFPSLSPSLDHSPKVTKHSNANQVAPSESSPARYERLFTPTPSVVERSALFEDTPKPSREIPGALHLQNDGNVEHLLSKTGAVALVKQMAQDLAQRDAQVTLLQRRAEEREALLRRMLRECQVSNLDIENRLKDLERAKHWSTIRQIDDLSSQNSDLGTQSNASMQDRLSLAFGDTYEARETLGSDRLREFSDNNSDTIRGSRRRSAQASLRRTATTSRGWKDFFLPGGGTNRESAPSQDNVRINKRSISSNSLVRPGLPPRRLNSSVFDPPTPSLSRKSSTTTSLHEDGDQGLTHVVNVAESDSVTSTKSVAAWALRLVAGNAQSTRNNLSDQTNGTGGLSSANGADRETASLTNSAADKAMTNATMKRLTASDARSSRSSLISANDSNKNVKLAPSESSRASAKDNIAPNSPPEYADNAGTNLGPVEMDTILPEGTRPPTLTQNVPNSSTDEYLTDSFGFIYDQRRRRRQNEAASALAQNKLGNAVESLRDHRSMANDSANAEISSIENHPGLTKVTSGPETMSTGKSRGAPDAPKRWQDYLKLATFSTELLSHTPSAGPITDITTAVSEEDSPEDIQNHLHKSKLGSMPALGQVPTPSASRVVSDNAELVISIASNPASPSADLEAEIDPVKALVEHLTEVHEAAQREKAIKWNDFLRKVRVDRRRTLTTKAANENRSRSSTMPETLLADGEMTGIAGLGVKGKVGRAKGSEFRALILGGIPTAYRSKIWAEGSGALNLRIPGYYEELTKSNFTDMAIVQQIQMDITRTLTDNVYYRRGAGVDKLKEVLLAYARRNPEIGYCQGMNLITANLLLIMPTAEDAFWVLTSMVENILPEKYYDSSLLTSRADQVVLRQYVSEILPQLSAHLEHLGIELEALTFQWFLSVFTDCLSAEALFRVWDVILCLSEGATFLFQVALALLKLNEKSLLKCENPAEVYGYINQGMTQHAISIDNLIRASELLKKEVRTEDTLKRRQEAVALELEMTRQREMIRKGKGKARATRNPSPPPASRSQYSPGQHEAIRATAADDFVKSRPGKLTRQASRGDFDEEARQAFGELEVRTPMPIDEEALWRG